MSLFVASTCQILGDIIVNHVAWSKVDQIAALSAYTVDDNDRETNQVLFTNNEVSPCKCGGCLVQLFMLQTVADHFFLHSG